MALLLFVTLFWAFSFSLIGQHLAGEVDSVLSAAIRTALAALLFLPLLHPRRTPWRKALTLAGIGGVQIGIMYLFYFKAFEFLSVNEVLIFTTLTPVYVTLLYDALAKRFTPWYLAVAALAVLGAVIIRLTDLSGSFIVGFLIVQGSNLCFALGQVAYKRFEEPGFAQSRRTLDPGSFGYFYLGALATTTLAALLLADWSRLPDTPVEVGVLLWLGLGASGVGYFLWNRGALRVDPGTLAIMNNLLIPAGLIVNLSIWGRDTSLDELVRLTIGAGIILGALLLNRFFIARHGQSAPAA